MERLSHVQPSELKSQLQRIQAGWSAKDRQRRAKTAERRTAALWELLKNSGSGTYLEGTA